MFSGDLESLLNQPGSYPGERRVLRIPGFAGLLVLETWNGSQWVLIAVATDRASIGRWIANTNVAGVQTPWTDGTGRHRGEPAKAAPH